MMFNLKILASQIMLIIILMQMVYIAAGWLFLPLLLWYTTGWHVISCAIVGIVLWYGTLRSFRR